MRQHLILCGACAMILLAPKHVRFSGTQSIEMNCVSQQIERDDLRQQKSSLIASRYEQFQGRHHSSFVLVSWATATPPWGGTSSSSGPGALAEEEVNMQGSCPPLYLFQPLSVQSLSSMHMHMQHRQNLVHTLSCSMHMHHKQILVHTWICNIHKHHKRLRS